MSENEAGTHYYSAYISQNGSNLTALLSERDCETLFDAVHRQGIPVGVWTTYNNRSLGITLCPRRGGVVLNMEPAASLPSDGHGKILSPEQAQQHQQAGGQVAAIAPKDQQHAKVTFPDWSEEEAEAAEALGALAELFQVQARQTHVAPADPASVGGPGTAGPVAPPSSRPAPPPPGPGVETTPVRTAYRQLQDEARKWGVSPVNRTTEALRADIARAKAATAENDNNGVPAPSQATAPTQ